MQLFFLLNVLIDFVIFISIFQDNPTLALHALISKKIKFERALSMNLKVNKKIATVKFRFCVSINDIINSALNDKTDIGLHSVEAIERRVSPHANNVQFSSFVLSFIGEYTFLFVCSILVSLEMIFLKFDQ